MTLYLGLILVRTHAPAIFAAIFRLVHGGIRAAQQFLCVKFTGNMDSQTDTGGDYNFVFTEFKWSRYRGNDFIRYRFHADLRLSQSV